VRERERERGELFFYKEKKSISKLNYFSIIKLVMKNIGAIVVGERNKDAADVSEFCSKLSCWF